MLEQFFDNKINSIAIQAEADENIIKIINNYKEQGIRGVLLIDEIEEAYDNFKKLVEYFTTPFRGLFDKVLDGTLKFFPILAFGPSSALMETSGLAAGWRTKTISIPMITSGRIEDFLVDLDIDYPYKSLIANMLWWASKGRIGWAYNLVINEVASSVVGILKVLRKDKKFIKKILIPFNSRAHQTLRKTIVADIPLFNEHAYREHYNQIPLPIEKDLFKLLTVLVGPIPKKELEKIVEGLDRVCGVKLEKIVYSTNAISKEYLVEKITEIARGLVRQLYSTYSEQRQDEIVEDIRNIIDMVLESWSYNDIILLPRTNGSYDISPLEKLRDVAINVALEMYKNEAIEILDKISISSIVDNIIRGKDPEALIPLDEEYFAIHPSVLIDIYPPIAVKPYIACSKGFKGDLASYMIGYVTRRGSMEQEYINIVRQALEYMAEYFQNKELLKNVKIYFIPSMDLVREETVRRIILRDLVSCDTRTIAIIPIATSASKLESLKEELARELEHYEKLGLVFIADTPPKLSMFLTGFLYSIMNCPGQLNETLRSNKIDRYIFRQYVRSFESLIVENTSKWYNVIRAIRDLETELFTNNRRLDELSMKLVSERGRTIGSEQAKYGWLISLADEDIINLLFKYLDTLIKIRNLLSDVLQELLSLKNGNVDSELIERIEKSVFKDIRLLTQQQAKRYLEDSIELARLLEELINKYDMLKYIVNVVDDVVRSELEYATLGNLCSNIGDLAKDIVKSLRCITEKISSRIISEPTLYILVARILSRIINEKCNSRILSFNVREKVSQLSEIEQLLREVSRSINELEGNIAKLKLKKPILIDKLVELGKDLNSLVNLLEGLRTEIGDNIIKMLDKLQPYSSILYVEFVIDYIIQKFIENILGKRGSAELLNEINELKSLIENINGSLIEIDNDVSKLTPEILLYVEKLEGEDIVEELRKDINNIFFTTSNLEELSSKLKEYVEQRLIDKLIDSIKEMKREIEEAHKIRENLNSIISLVDKILEE